jgi:SEC-C motif-containing protein
MRSRYSAYAKGIVDYILSTQKAPASPQEILRFTSETTFLGLKILSSREEGDTGEVTFTAYLAQNSKNQTFTEVSSFKKEQGRWLYTEGKVCPGEKLLDL